MAPRAPATSPAGRRLFDTETVAAAALRLLDEGGADALSIRGVATALGVRPNAIYTYVASRSALERVVVEQLLAHAVATTPSVSDPVEAIEALALSVRAALLDHPAAAPLMMSAPMDGPAALDLGERLLDALRLMGLTPGDAARACWTVIVHVLGSVALDAAETDGRRPLPSESDRIAARSAALGTVDAERWPLTAAATATMAAWISADQFTWGLRCLLAGLVPRA